MSSNASLFRLGPERSAAAASSPGATGAVICPSCAGNVVPSKTETRWQACQYCERRLQAWSWSVARQTTNAIVAMADQATCFFHPEKVFQTCCQRCGRFLCGLCDLQLGAEHVCPVCFERGREIAGTASGTAEWRHRDVLYDSIALSVGWGWIVIWPTIVAAIPAAIFLHVKYRRAPRSYLIPRSGWRFWMAYAGLVFFPLLVASMILIPRLITGRH